MSEKERGGGQCSGARMVRRNATGPASAGGSRVDVQRSKPAYVR